jgi:hypothetical protein
MVSRISSSPPLRARYRVITRARMDLAFYPKASRVAVRAFAD